MHGRGLHAQEQRRQSIALRAGFRDSVEPVRIAAALGCARFESKLIEKLRYITEQTFCENAALLLVNSVGFVRKFLRKFRRGSATVIELKVRR